MKNTKKVSFVRLLTGDDLIGELVKKTAKTITIKNPMMMINNIEMLEGKQTLILYPWIPQGVAIGDTATVNNSFVVIINDVEPDIIEYYESIVESQLTNKPTVTSSTVKTAAELEATKGMNVIQFSDAVVKSKKDIN